MATTHIIDKVKIIAEKAKTIHVACDSFLNDPNVQEVADLFAMFNAFANGQPNPNNGAKPKRVRRSRAEIDAANKANGEGKGG